MFLYLPPFLHLPWQAVPLLAAQAVLAVRLAGVAHRRRWLACRLPGRHARRRAAVTRIRDVDPAAWNGDPRCWARGSQRGKS